jgi:hypothetical protein
VKNLGTYMKYFVDQFITFSEVGIDILDNSYPPHSPRHKAKLDCMLLGLIGDYDALGKAACLVGAGNIIQPGE